MVGIAAKGSFSRKLLKSGLGSAGVNVLQRLLALGSGIILARGLGTEGYGTYAYALAMMGLLMIAAEAGIPNLLMREVAACQAREQWGALKGAIVRGSQVVLVVSLLVMLLGHACLWFFRNHFDSSFYVTTLIMLLVLPMAATLRTMASAIKGLHRVVAGQAIEMLVPPSLMLIVLVPVFLLSTKYRAPEYVMGAQLVTMFIVLLLSLVLLRRLVSVEVLIAPRVMPSGAWVRRAIPFTLIGGALIINNQADVIMLGWFRPVSEVGVYRVSSQSAMLVGFLLQAGGAVAGPHFASLFANNDKHKIAKLLRRTTLLAALGSLPIALALVFYGDIILALVFGEPYRVGGLTLAILTVGYFANVSFGPVGMLLQMVGEESVTARLLWVTAGLNIVLNLILIPNFGSVGAAIATAVSVALYHGILRVIVRSRIGV